MKKLILSGAFILTLLFCTAIVTAQCSVVLVGQDMTTGGDWDGVTNPANPVGSPIGVYGSYAHILPGAPVDGLEIPIGPFETPIGVFDPPNLWWTGAQLAGIPYHAASPPYWDEYESLYPQVTYSVRGTLYVPGLPLPVPETIQYPVFVWPWGPWNVDQDPLKPWEVYYRTLGGAYNWRRISWDDGGERCRPENGYMDFELFFPEGMYLLSLYAYDDDVDERDSELIQIYDATVTTLLASTQISDPEFNTGVYGNFTVEAGSGGCTIVVRIYNDDGHISNDVPTVNVVLSGIFVDKLSVPGHTIGWWKNNVDKNIDGENAKGKVKQGNAQLTLTEINDMLACVSSSFCNFCGTGEADDFLCSLDLDKASAILNNHKQQDLPKAQAQILGLLLSTCYFGPDYLDHPIYLPDVGQTGGAFLGILEDAVQLILDEYCAGNYGVAHELATFINEME